MLKEWCSSPLMCTASIGKMARCHKEGRHYTKREGMQPLDVLLLVMELFKVESFPTVLHAFQQKQVFKSSASLLDLWSLGSLMPNIRRTKWNYDTFQSLSIQNNRK